MAARRSKPLLRGYKRVSRRRFLTPAGKEISEHEYRNRVARKSGFDNYYRQRQFRESRDFLSWRFKARTFNPDEQVGVGSSLEIHLREVEHLRDLGDEDALHSPDGPLAALLTDVGYRRDEWAWGVGDTPKGVRA